MNIKGKKVTLRAIDKEDLDLMRDMLNDEELEHLVVGWAFPISKHQQEQWFLNNINSNINLRFIIEDENHEAVGIATLTDIDWKNRKALHGMKLALSKNRSKGLGTDTVMAIMRYAFDELQLNRLDGSILDYNVGSKKLYCDRCGWQVEGVQRKYVYKNGTYHDLQIVGILNEDYKELVEKTRYWD